MPISAQSMYGNGVLGIVENLFKWSDGAQAFNASLHTSTYTPNNDTHDFFDDATNEIAAGSGYSSGGVALASRTVAIDAATNQVRLDCADILFNFSGSKTFRHMVVRRARGGAASADNLVGYWTWDSDQTVSAPYTLTVDATGLLRFTY